MQAPEKLEAARVRAALRRKLFGTPTPTTRIGRYELLRPLGAGAMGAVFLARDTELEREVALKVLRTTEQSDDVRRRLLREARAMAKLRHPNVVTVFEAGVADDAAFIAMEYVDGTTLRGWLATDRGAEAIVGVFVQAARGLAAAHEAGLIHRDFKPDNVLIDADGRVQVTDFGVARAIEIPDATHEPHGPDRPPGHTERARAGTPLYMAPEQHRGEAVDARTDQFAFCVALHEALAGELPFSGTSLSELADAAARGPQRPVPDHVPTWLGAAIATGLRPDPSERHPSMAALVEALRSGEGRPSKRHRPLLIALLATAGIAALVIAGNDPPPRSPTAATAPTTTPTTQATPTPSAEPPSSLGSIAFAAGALVAGEPWLPSFRIVHHPEVGLSWLDAAERCRSSSLTLCTDPQWQRACEEDDRLASMPTWTATADGDRGFVTRGAGTCNARAVAPPSQDDPALGGLCCSRAVAMVGERPETADRIMSTTLKELESALGEARISVLESMAGDRVDHRSDAMSKDRFLAVLLADARREPDRWELHDTCDGRALPREGERAWTAECRTLVYRGGRIGAVQRRYTFSGPHGTLSGVDEPHVFRQLSAPTR